MHSPEALVRHYVAYSAKVKYRRTKKKTTLLLFLHFLLCEILLGE